MFNCWHSFCSKKALLWKLLLILTTAPVWVSSVTETQSCKSPNANFNLKTHVSFFKKNPWHAPLSAANSQRQIHRFTGLGKKAKTVLFYLSWINWRGRSIDEWIHIWFHWHRPLSFPSNFHLQKQRLREVWPGQSTNARSPSLDCPSRYIPGCLCTTINTTD